MRDGAEALFQLRLARVQYSAAFETAGLFLQNRLTADNVGCVIISVRAPDNVFSA